VIDDATLAETGRLIWAAAQRAPLFALGSQGLEDALLAAWVAAGHRAPGLPAAPRVAQIAVVSGSCSPDTARQIAAARAQGYAALRVDASQAMTPQGWHAECARAEAAALAALATGQSVILFTALGPDDPALARVSEAARTTGQDMDQVNATIGTGLGQVLARLAARARLPRVAIAGGDTSGRATRGLGLVALTVAGTVAPAVPLLLGHAADPATPPLELVLKGGQMGKADLFLTLRDGATSQG
jgi:3-oxoisoapionate kinase